MLLGKNPDDLLWLLLSVFAIWRLTAMIVYETGPFEVLVALRRALVRIGLGRLVGCFYCLSVWTSCAVVLVFPLSLATPLVFLGVAGAVAMIERALSGSLSTGDDEERSSDGD